MFRLFYGRFSLTLARHDGYTGKAYASEQLPWRTGRTATGGLAEWLKATVLKTVDGVTRPGVRIPHPPPKHAGFLFGEVAERLKARPC